MMLIFEEIQILKHFRQRLSKTSPLPPPLRTCIVWDVFQGNKEIRRLREAMILNNEKRRDSDCQLPNLELNR